jgi:hypothetical protein
MSHSPAAAASWSRPANLLSAVPLLVLTSAVAGCNARPSPAPPPPTESLTVVEASSSPLLNEIEDDEAAAEVAHAGELVFVGRDLRPLSWEARMEDQKAHRDGMLLELRKGAGTNILFGFRNDLGAQVTVPAASWICDAIAGDRAVADGGKLPNCSSALRRARLPEGALAAFIACGQGPCPVAIVREGRVAAATFDDLASIDVRRVGNRMALVATSRWARGGGAWTGGRLLILDVSGAIPALGRDVPADEVDARDPAKVTSRTVSHRIDTSDPQAPVLRVVGERIETRLADGNVVSRTPIDERYPLLPNAPSK